MFFSRLSQFALIAVLATVGAQDPLYGQPQPPMNAAANAASPLPQFRPITEADAQDALAQVKAAAADLEKRFDTAGASAASWKDYLSWDKVRSELQKTKPDKDVLDKLYSDLALGYDGLELKWFADLRTALGNYVALVPAVGNPDVAAAFKGQVDELTEAVKSLGAHPTTSETRKIADHLAWLETARQAPELVSEVRTRFSTPNFHVQIGAEVVALGVGGPIDDVAPISDCILKTAICGTGRTIGQTTSAVAPDPNVAVFDAVVNGTNYSNNVGYHGPVVLYTTGQTFLWGNKRFYLDEAGIHALPAQATANANSSINCIVSVKGHKMVERFAWRRAGKQKGQADAIASGHAANKFAARIDSQAEPMIQQANEQLDAKVRQPLQERRLFPAVLRFDSLASVLEIHGLEALKSQLAAPSPPPELTAPADISVRIHESTVNNAAESVLTGMRLNDEMVQRTALEILGSVPEQLKSEDQEPFTLVFYPEIKRLPPITVSFADGGFKVTLRGQEFILGDKQRPGADITADYQFVKSPEGSGTMYSWSAVRQGDLQIRDADQRPGVGLSARQKAVHSALQRKFGKLFPPEIKLQGFKVQSGKLASAGDFVPQEIISQNGWLAVGYSRRK